VDSQVTLDADRGIEIVLLEASGGTPTPEQKAFRDNWLGSKAK
jgi:hypothetical protein